jgi:hypothetical protein
LILVGIIASVFSGVGRADLLSGCVSCLGSTYLLTYNPTPVAVNGGVKTYDVTLTVNTTGYTQASTDWLGDVAIKIASQVEDVGSPNVTTTGNLDGKSYLVAAPVGTWHAYATGLSANGCAGGGSGFFCTQDGTSATVGGVYTWEFFYATDQSLLTGHLAASVKAGYYEWVQHGNKPPEWQNTGITSAGITLQSSVPDGGMTLMLLGGALVGLETLRRRFRA